MESQNRAAIDSEKDKKKGKHVLNNLSCSITYERSRRRQLLKVGKADCELNGDGSHENIVLECVCSRVPY